MGNIAISQTVAMELWLVRHGETEWSLSGAHTSRTDIPLTEHGRKRAEELRDYLKGTKFDAVFESPMQRARETCAIAGFGDVAEVDKGLREWDYGVYEGKTTKEIQAEIPGWSVWKNEIVGGETVEHVGERADGVIAAGAAGGVEIAGPTAEGGAVCACAYLADSGGAMDWIACCGWEFAGAGDRECECDGVGAGDACDLQLESRV